MDRETNAQMVARQAAAQALHGASVIKAVSDFEQDVTGLFDQARDTLLSKHRDYGPKNIADAPGGAVNGIRVRIHDKISRINHLVDRVQDPEHESLEDSFLDLANYALIAVLVLRGQWPK